MDLVRLAWHGYWWTLLLVAVLGVVFLVQAAWLPLMITGGIGLVLGSAGALVFIRIFGVMGTISIADE